jgi:hypothetical protein
MHSSQPGNSDATNTPSHEHQQQFFGKFTMKEIYDVLAAWASLSRQCKLMESNLLSLKSAQPQADTSAMEAEVQNLKQKTQAAFKAASEAIRRSPSRAAGSP